MLFPGAVIRSAVSGRDSFSIATFSTSLSTGATGMDIGLGTGNGTVLGVSGLSPVALPTGTVRMCVCRTPGPGPVVADVGPVELAGALTSPA